MQPSMDTTNTLDEWLAYCEQLHPKGINGIELGLDRIRAVAQRMELRFACPVITVAGTNGKGSTCAMLESILGQAGYKTGVFTSPHLVRFEERLRLLGEAVSATKLVAAFADVAKGCRPKWHSKHAMKSGSPTLNSPPWPSCT